MVDKFDVKKALKDLYGARNSTFEILRVPRMTYLALDGEGSPDSENFAKSIQALYSTAYPLKFESKKKLSLDYTIPPLEALWWAEDPAAFALGERDSWRWTLLSFIPHWITDDLVTTAKNMAINKGYSLASSIQIRSIEEGLCFQLLHIGPFSSEAEKLSELHEHMMPDNSCTFNGPHHEIYLSDFRKTQPDKLRTILRQPIKPL